MLVFLQLKVLTNQTLHLSSYLLSL